MRTMKTLPPSCESSQVVALHLQRCTTNRLAQRPRHAARLPRNSAPARGRSGARLALVLPSAPRRSWATRRQPLRHRLQFPGPLLPRTLGALHPVQHLLFGILATAVRRPHRRRRPLAARSSDPQAFATSMALALSGAARLSTISDEVPRSRSSGPLTELANASSGSRTTLKLAQILWRLVGGDAPRPRRLRRP